MVNQLVLVGRLVRDPEVIERDGRKLSTITIAVQRPFKNIEGEYEVDYINCVLWNSIAENTSVYCKQGDVVGVKARVQSNSYEDKDGEKRYSMDIIAERISFVASKDTEKKIKENDRDER